MNIIAQLQGGLGNQLFQYATARTLADRLNAHLQLDTAWFKNSYIDVTKRDIELTDLNIDAELVSELPLKQRPKRIRRIAQKLLPINPYFYAEKEVYRFDDHLYKIPRFRQQDVYLLGYWQSYKYFSEIRTKLIAQIRPRNNLNQPYQELFTQIQKYPSAMVHIRRGDYIHLAAASKVHGFVGLKYYEAGMAKLLAQNPEIKFFVFSDDIAWAHQHLPHQEKLIFVQTVPEMVSTTQELFLMSQCNYQLIANSSLSWWGAWLAHGNTSVGKVICPSNWTNDHHINWDDLLPNSWERI